MLALLLAATLYFPFDARVLTVPTQTFVEYVPDARDLWITKLGDCESHGSTTVRILDVNNKYSYGLLMFQMATWLHYGKDLGATRDNIYDPDLQRGVARTMLDAGGWKNWYNCANKIGPYPD